MVPLDIRRGAEPVKLAVYPVQPVGRVLCIPVRTRTTQGPLLIVTRNEGSMVGWFTLLVGVGSLLLHTTTYPKGNKYTYFGTMVKLQSVSNSGHTRQLTL